MFNEENIRTVWSGHEESLQHVASISSYSEVYSKCSFYIFDHDLFVQVCMWDGEGWELHWALFSHGSMHMTTNQCRHYGKSELSFSKRIFSWLFALGIL